MTELMTAPTSTGDAIEVAHDQPPVLITEQQVLFASAAAVAVPPARTSNWFVGAAHAFADAIRGVLVASNTHTPSPRYRPSRNHYFEDSRMSREMDRL